MQTPKIVKALNVEPCDDRFKERWPGWSEQRFGSDSLPVFQGCSTLYTCM